MNNEPVAWMYESKNVDGKPYISDVSLKPLFGLVTRYGYKEIPLYTHPVKELTRADRSKLIGTLKWAEDLLRVAGHDEAVSDVQDCLMILRKAQEK